MLSETSFHQPRISRETRRLLLAAVIALVVLWLLARARFTEAGPPTAPVQPLLGQLAPRPTFAELASDVARIQSRLQSSLFVANGAAALRITETEALAVLPADASPLRESLSVIAADPATGVTLLAVEPGAAVAGPLAWAPRRAREPRYLLATTASPAGVALQPVFVPSLESVSRTGWSDAVWLAGPGSGLEPGSFVFTTNGELAGLVVGDGDAHTIVPGDVLLREAERMRVQPERERGHLGVDVQSLTPALASVTGSTGGVMVSWVDPQGPAAGSLVPGDVIEAADGQRVAPDQWTLRAARLARGDTMTLRVRRDGEMREVVLVATPLPAQAAPAVLGLTMRAIPGVGSEVISVQAYTAAQRAGVTAGDVITRAGITDAPMPAQVRAAYEAGRGARGVLLALARGSAHRVVALTP